MTVIDMGCLRNSYRCDSDSLETDAVNERMLHVLSNSYSVSASGLLKGLHKLEAMQHSS